MSDKFIEQIAELRAKHLFTKEFFETCTDSWYYDEFFEFKANHKIGIKQRKPTNDEAYKYMGYLQKLKDKYYDDLFTSENALTQYNIIIDKLHEVLNLIDEGNKKYKAFNCTEDIISHLKSIGNYFVNKYNTILPEYNHKVSK